MRHVLYALFPARSEADAAVREIRMAGIPPEHVTLVVHEGAIDQDDLEFSESDARKGLIRGGVAGGLGGAVLGVLLAGPVSLLPMNELIAGAGGLVLGGLIGGLGGTLFGAGLPDQGLKALADKLGPGRVLITAQVEGQTAYDQVEHIFQRHRALEAR